MNKTAYLLNYIGYYVKRTLSTVGIKSKTEVSAIHEYVYLFRIKLFKKFSNFNIEVNGDR